MSTFGPAYESRFDEDRIRRQHHSIRRLMSDGNWRSLNEIAKELGYPEASISAQLRHLRKPEFGNLNVIKRRRAGGLWEYHVEESRFNFDVQGQGDMFPVKHDPFQGH